MVPEARAKECSGVVSGVSHVELEEKMANERLMSVYDSCLAFFESLCQVIEDQTRR